MELLGGKLEIESKENEYTKVTLSFIQRIVEDNMIREKLEKNKTAETFDLMGKKILIVDDNKLNLKVTKRLLEPYNVDVTLLESGIEALEHVRENNVYDLILLDQMMPGVNGVETLHALKEIDGFDTPVVVLTADAIKGKKEEYLSLGSGKNVHIDDYYEYTPSPYSVERSEKQFVISDNTSEIAVIDESFLKNTVYYDLIEKYEFLPFQYSLAYNKITLVYRAKPALSPTAHYPMLVFEYDVTSNELIYLAVFNPYDCEGMQVLYNIKTILQD
jgi:CheY-like chemotaxis protein